MNLHVEHFTDPACPFAFSAEPVRQRLKWRYGDQLVWYDRMIVLTANDPQEAETLAGGAPNLQRRYGMPIDPTPRARPASSEPACRAVVAARLHAPEATETLLRRLRVHTMAGGLLDDLNMIAVAARESGLSPETLEEWCRRSDVEQELERDMEAARSPSTEIQAALRHKLSGRDDRVRFSAPTYRFRRSDGNASFVLPGFNAVEAYEAAIANIAPELRRRPGPTSVEELLEWPTEPLATAEIALLLQIDVADARTQLARTAQPIAAGADFYWIRSEVPPTAPRPAPTPQPIACTA